MFVLLLCEKLEANSEAQRTTFNRAIGEYSNTPISQPALHYTLIIHKYSCLDLSCYK